MTARDEDLVRAWNRLQRNWWAHGEVFRACKTQPHRAWRLLGRMAELATTDELVTDLGAGPLEDFVRAHAPKFIRQIERRAKECPKFRRALRNVYLPQATDAVSSRLLALGVIAIKTKPAQWQSRITTR